MGLHTYQTNFTGGTLSPYLFSRSDFKKYPNGAEILDNIAVKVSGGAVRRAGTQFVATAKQRSAFQASMVQDNAFQVNPSGKILLVPFIFNTNEAYMLEFGGGYIRFYRNRKQILGSGFGSELVTNGKFDTDLTGWTLQQDNGGTVVWDAGHAVLSPGAAGTAGISQSIGSLDPADTYVLDFESSGSMTFQVGTLAGQSDLVAPTVVSAGQFRATFKPTVAGTAVIQWINTQPNSVRTLDNVTMLEAAPLEIATPYTPNEVRFLRFAQSGDVMWICHPSHPVMELTRLGDALWTLQETIFNPPPSEEVPIKPETTLTPGATVGIGVNFDAGFNPTFLAADIHRQIKARGGVAVITAVVDGDSVTVDILAPFIDTNPIGAGLWSMDGSPSAAVTLSAVGPVNSVITATAGIAAFRTSDNGGFIHGNNGIAEIFEVTSSTVVKARVLKAFTGASLTAGAWFLQRDSFSDELGHPDVPVFFEQRLWFMKGNDIHGSVTGDFRNFADDDSNDDFAVRFPLAGRVDRIRWAKALKNFVIGTVGTEYKVDGGDNNAITPTNVHAAPQSDWGSDPEPDAITAGISALYVQRGRFNIREMAFDFTKDGFDSPDLAILADHLFGSGIIQLARCSSPDSFLLAAMADGSMNVATYERNEDVVAWTRFFGGRTKMGPGLYRSVAVIPAKCGTGDEIWIAIERNVNGRVDNYIEVFDGQLNTDCALVFDGNESVATAITGLGHLNLEEVDVLTSGQSFVQKGAFQATCFQRKRATYQKLVIDGTGSIEVPAPGAARAEIGLHYDSRIKTLRPDPAGQGGTQHFQKKRSNTVYVRFFCSGGDGIFVNGEPAKRALVEKQEIYDHTREANLGWDRDGQVEILQTHPFPMTVLGIAYSWQGSDGDNP